jgi:hypothetical protein
VKRDKHLWVLNFLKWIEVPSLLIAIDEPDDTHRIGNATLDDSFIQLLGYLFDNFHWDSFQVEPFSSFLFFLLIPFFFENYLNLVFVFEEFLHLLLQKFVVFRSDVEYGNQSVTPIVIGNLIFPDCEKAFGCSKLPELFVGIIKNIELLECDLSTALLSARENLAP